MEQPRGIQGEYEGASRESLYIQYSELDILNLEVSVFGTANDSLKYTIG